MSSVVTTFLHYPIIRGALSGWLAAAVVDLHAFMTWKNLQDLKKYDWSVAGFRWAQGIVSGALAGAGLGAIS